MLASQIRLLLWLIVLPMPVLAWGPHPTITQAALDVLGPEHSLVRLLGTHAQRLTNYAWMADYRNLIFDDAGEVFYANDYLLFPAAQDHYDHICPEVKKTYEPYFKRAMQAMRGETPANAARWVGSLLHFTEDTGAPPHAAEIRGALHSKMENWVVASQIQIPGYRPQLLGNTDEEALKGLEKRMDGIIDFSKERAKRMRLPAELGNRAEVEPIVLESALESSRTTADLLHTLGHLAAQNTNASNVVRGKVVSRDPAGTERFPAKVIVAGSLFSTMADLSGQFEFRNLPEGEHELVALRPGNGLARTSIVVRAGVTDLGAIPLPENPNLIRNADFQLSWVREGSPDFWISTRKTLDGEVIPLKQGQKYRLKARFTKNAYGSVMVRWAKPVTQALPRFAAMPQFKTKTLTMEESEWTFTAGPDLGLLHMTLLPEGKSASAVWEAITLQAEP